MIIVGEPKQAVGTGKAFILISSGRSGFQQGDINLVIEGRRIEVPSAVLLATVRTEENLSYLGEECVDLAQRLLNLFVEMHFLLLENVRSQPLQGWLTHRAR